MHRYDRPRIDSVAETTTASSTPGVGALLPAELSREQIERWAERIADGRDKFPEELSGSNRDRLSSEVRRRLRNRLIHLIARAIAANLRRDAGLFRKESSHE